MMKRKKRRISLLPVLVFFTFFYIYIGERRGEAVDGRGETENRVKTGDFVKTVILTGSLKARESERFVVPQTESWEVQIKWMVEEGEYVKAGDPVVRFDTATLGTDIENTENSLRAKEEQRKQKVADFRHQKFEQEVTVKQAENDSQKAQIDADIPPGLEARIEYDEKQLELKKKQQALRDARVDSEVKLAAADVEIKNLDIEIRKERTKLEKFKDQLNRLTLTAQTAGTVLYADLGWQGRKIQVGDTVYSSMPVAYIPDDESLQVEAWANESEIRYLHPGQKVTLIPDAYPDRQFPGTVKDVLNNAEDNKRWGKATYFRTVIELDSLDPVIMKQGMSVQCIVRVADHPGVILVPLTMAYYDGREFWIKPKGKKAIKIKPLGYNEFHLALPNSPKVPGEISNGDLLEQVEPGEITGINGGNPTQPTAGAVKTGPSAGRKNEKD